jgi:protein required for attachment to host cells
LTRALRSMVQELSDTSNTTEMNQLSDILRTMKTIKWMPIRITPPDGLPLPWKKTNTDIGLAAPYNCRSSDAMWLVSNDKYIVDDAVPTDMGPFVTNIFGWNEKISMKTLAQQLRGVAAEHNRMKRKEAIDALPMAEASAVYPSTNKNEKHPLPIATIATAEAAVVTISNSVEMNETTNETKESNSTMNDNSTSNSSNSNSNSSNSSRKIGRNILRIYDSMSDLLSASTNSNMNVDVQSLKEILREDVPCIYVDHQFIEVNKCAFRAPPGLDARPHLYQVPSEMLENYELLFSTLGMKEEFQPLDLFLGLRTLYKKSRQGKRKGEEGTPLDRKQTDFAVTIVNILSNGMERFEERTKRKENLNRNVFGLCDKENEEETKMNSSLTSLTSATSATSLMPSSPAASDLDDGAWIQQVKENMVVPDENLLLCPTKTMVYDDAPWLSASIQNRRSMHFIHKSISLTTAKRVGVRSLRRLLLSNREGATYAFPMSTSTLHDLMMGYDYSSRMLSDGGLHVGDLLKTSRIEIQYDSREHPNISLMSPLMSDLQGPGLLLRYPNTKIDAGSLMRLFSKNSLGEMKTGHGSLRLLSLFSVADCLLVVSGNSLFIIDPMNIYNNGSEEETKEEMKETSNNSNKREGETKSSSQSNRNNTSNSTSKSNSNRTVGIKEYNVTTLLRRFPDMFLPFFPKGERGYIGTLVRVPFRRRGSKLTNTIVGLNDIRHLLITFERDLSSMMVHGTSVNHVAVTTIGKR